MSALNCFELSLEGFEWTLHCGEGQLTETGERLLNGCLRPFNLFERQATISESNYMLLAPQGWGAKDPRHFHKRKFWTPGTGGGQAL